ncbi:hypothetical protein RZS08_52035, partial [Arthrospira platensis SPKY1]|nr:hypothetical protein [Arthrospira platensis SPKY1]
ADINGAQLLSHKIAFHDSVSTIDLYYIGRPIGDDTKAALRASMKDYGLIQDGFLPMTKDVRLTIHQEADNVMELEKKLNELNNSMRVRMIEDLYSRNEELLQSKDQQIQLLERELIRYKESDIDTIQLGQIAKEL